MSLSEGSRTPTRAIFPACCAAAGIAAASGNAALQRTATNARHFNARIAIKLPQLGRTFPPSGNRDVIPKRYQIVEFAPSVLEANAKARARSVPTTFGQRDAG
ncbi:MAG: hypothetical protein WCD67_24300 [Xanthobacteraceae bacterium]